MDKTLSIIGSQNLMQANLSKAKGGKYRKRLNQCPHLFKQGKLINAEVIIKKCK